ncbi:MAG: hypothetical protein K2J40_07125 [Ruminococcus sp.]|nr:hypothetical protein [Ruminococcus sp.]
MEEIFALGLLIDWNDTAENLYNRKLDELFLENPDNPDLLELELKCGSIKETVIYIRNHINFSNINTETFVKSLVGCLKILYYSMDIEIFSKLSYRLWLRLPSHISENSLLSILNYMDDYVSIGFIDSAKQNYERLFAYYE